MTPRADIPTRRREGQRHRGLVASPDRDGSSRAYRAARLVAVRAWAVVGVVAVFVIAVRGLSLVGPALECLLVGCLGGYACSSITNWLERRGLGRAVGAFAALLVVMGVMVALVLWLVPLFVSQLSQLLERVPAFFSQAQSLLADLWTRFGTEDTLTLQSDVSGVLAELGSMLTQMAGDLARSLSQGLFPNVMNFANGLVMFFLGLVMAYWLAKDYPIIVREFGVVVGPRYGDALALLIAVLSRSVGGYLRGIVITSVFNGLLAFVGLTLVGHPYAGLMGAIVGIMHFVPVVGPVVSAALATLVALFAGPVVVAWTLVVTVVAQNVTDNVLSPLVMRSAVKIHPAMSLVGITVGASLGGAMGMTLAVPLTAAIKGVFVYWFETRTSRQLVSYDGAFFQGTPYHHEDGSPVPSFDALDDDKFLRYTKLVKVDAETRVAADEPPAGTRAHMAELLRHQVEDLAQIPRRTHGRKGSEEGGRSPGDEGDENDANSGNDT